MRTGVVLVAAALAIGAGALLLLERSGPPDRIPIPSLRSGSEQRPETARRRGERRQRPTRASTPAESGEQREGRAIDAAPAGEVPESEPSEGPPAPAGKGRIAGEVIDVYDLPVEDSVVELWYARTAREWHVGCTPLLVRGVNRLEFRLEGTTV